MEEVRAEVVMGLAERAKVGVVRAVEPKVVVAKETARLEGAETEVVGPEEAAQVEGCEEEGGKATETTGMAVAAAVVVD